MRSDAEAEANASRCPVCGLENACAVEAGSTAPCWCTELSISPEALARIPAALADKACLCPRCAAFTAANPRAGESA